MKEEDFLIQYYGQLLNTNIQQQMKERVYNKQNNYNEPYHVRTKQFNNYTPAKEKDAYQPRVRQNINNNPQDLTAFQRYPKYDYDHYDISKTRKERGASYLKNDRSQVSEKYQFSDKMSKLGAIQHLEKYKQDTFADHSFGETTLQSDLSYNPGRRQNAKRKGLDIKMSNINSISDKINTLLSMVKKDKNNRAEDQRSPPINYSPTANRNLSQSFHMNENRKTKDSGKKIEEVEYKNIERQSQKLRTLSAFEQKSSNKKPQQQVYTNNYNNEEDRHIGLVYNPKNYSPSRQKADRYPIDSNYQYQNYDKQPVKNERKSPINQRRKDPQIGGSSPKAQRRSNMQGDRTITPSKYQNIDIQLKNLTPQKIHYERTPTRNSDNNFMPITLQQNTGSSSGMKMVDDRIKSIKQKINQSENQNRKYQQKLQGRQEKNHVTAGKIYNNESNSSKKFELKIYPVVNQKPETIKIAQKLCYQVQVDNRMRKGRQEFHKIQGEDKWKKLEQMLCKSGIKLTLFQVKQLITFSPDQFSPFDNYQSSLNVNLCKSFGQAQKFWQKQVSGCVNMKSLKKQGFMISDIDLNKKGYLNIEDLVCFVNLYTGHFYKNRDFAIIYRRLQLLERGRRQVGIEFATFFRAFTI